MNSVITEMLEATDENIKGLKVIGITINTYITETLIQHGRSEEAHSGLKETYIQSIMTDLTAGLAEMEEAKSELEDIIQKLEDMSNRLDKLESKNE